MLASAAPVDLHLGHYLTSAPKIGSSCPHYGWVLIVESMLGKQNYGECNESIQCSLQFCVKLVNIADRKFKYAKLK